MNWPHSGRKIKTVKMNFCLFFIVLIVGVANHVDGAAVRYVPPVRDYLPLIEEPYPSSAYPKLTSLKPAYGCYDRLLPEVAPPRPTRIDPPHAQPSSDTATSYSNVNVFPSSPFTPELMQYLSLLATAPPPAPVAPPQLPIAIPNPPIAIPNPPMAIPNPPCEIKNPPCAIQDPPLVIQEQPYAIQDQPWWVYPNQPCAARNQPFVYEPEPYAWQPQPLPCPKRACPTCASEIDFPMYYL